MNLKKNVQGWIKEKDTSELVEKNKINDQWIYSSSFLYSCDDESMKWNGKYRMLLIKKISALDQLRTEVWIH